MDAGIYYGNGASRNKFRHPTQGWIIICMTTLMKKTDAKVQSRTVVKD